jgi:hypothetical protein
MMRLACIFFFYHAMGLLRAILVAPISGKLSFVSFLAFWGILIGRGESLRNGDARAKYCSDAIVRLERPARLFGETLGTMR